eukprot:scaffold13929_cov97-Isochrysis_galbana.AAC.3
MGGLRGISTPGRLLLDPQPTLRTAPIGSWKADWPAAPLAAGHAAAPGRHARAAARHPAQAKETQGAGGGLGGLGAHEPERPRAVRGVGRKHHQRAVAARVPQAEPDRAAPLNRSVKRHVQEAHPARGADGIDFATGREGAEEAASKTRAETVAVSHESGGASARAFAGQRGVGRLTQSTSRTRARHPRIAAATLPAAAATRLALHLAFCRCAARLAPPTRGSCSASSCPPSAIGDVSCSNSGDP